jgi:hypothetical protein
MSKKSLEKQKFPVKLLEDEAATATEQQILPVARDGDATQELKADIPCGRATPKRP